LNNGLLEWVGNPAKTSYVFLVFFPRDAEPIVRHEEFRMFACMNPANDVGKKDLPAGIRNRFTEIFVSELQDISDLKTLVFSYLRGLSPPATLIDGIVR
jgi:midasin